MSGYTELVLNIEIQISVYLTIIIPIIELIGQTMYFVGSYDGVNYKIAAFQGAVMLTSEGNPIAMAVVGR